MQHASRLLCLPAYSTTLGHAQFQVIVALQATHNGYLGGKLSWLGSAARVTETVQ